MKRIDKLHDKLYLNDFCFYDPNNKTEVIKTMGIIQKLQDFRMAKKGSMVGGIVGLIVAIITLVAVAIPITQDVITDANLTGISATIVEFLPVFLALAGLALVAGIVTTRN